MALYQHANPLNTAGISVFDVLREELDVRDLVEHDGRGKECRCPSANHEDKNPSAHIYDDGRVHCFGCGWHGDVVDVWAERKGFDNLMEAALDLAREYGVRLPEATPEARARAQEARKKEESYALIARACHTALKAESGTRVREWLESRGFSEELQAHFLLGANKEGTEAAIPFWRRGRIVGMVRRPVDHDGDGPKYVYSKKEEFAPGHRPLFIPGPLQKEVFVVEGILDSLSLVAIGKSAIAVGGTNLSVEQIMEVDKIASGGRRLYLLPDADENGKGKQAAVAWARLLYPSALICRADYGDERKDFADLFAAVGHDGASDYLGDLVTGAVDLVDMLTQVAKEMNSWRDQFAYATKEIVPLIARVEPESMRAATIDAVGGELKKHIKVQWLKAAVKEEYEQIIQEGGAQMMQALKEAQERAEQEHREWLEENAEEIGDLLKPGVLERMRKQAARMHNVKRDVESLKLAILVALGAQLAPLPSGRPLGASMLLTGEAGRGKNHNVDAACRLLPEEFYFAFEIASGQSLYYMAELDPNFLKHTFAYPNEIEGAEALWEFLRPMLSKGRALKIVTAKDAEGNMTTKEIMVEGPVTIAIPTIRNRTDEQLQTRLLVSELTDYPGRVKEHSRGVTEQLHPKFASWTSRRSGSSGRRRCAVSRSADASSPRSITPTSPLTMTGSPTARGSGPTYSGSWRPTRGWRSGTGRS